MAVRYILCLQDLSDNQAVAEVAGIDMRCAHYCIYPFAADAFFNHGDFFTQAEDAAAGLSSLPRFSI